MNNSIFNNFLKNPVVASEKNQEQLMKIRFIISTSFIGIVVFLFFGSLHFLNRDFFIGFIELVFCGVLIVNLLLLRFFKSLSLSSIMMLLSMIGVLLGIFYFGGFGRIGIVWFSSFPVVAFFLEGKRKGLMWSIGFSLFIVLLFFLQEVIHLIPFSFDYSLIELVQVFINYFTLVFISYFYAYIRDQNESMLYERQRQNQQMYNQLHDQVLVLNESEKRFKQSNDELEKTKKAMLNVLEDLQSDKKEIASAKAQDEAIISSIADGFFMTDPFGKLLFMNDPAEKLFTCKKEVVIGKLVEEVFAIADEKGNPFSSETRPLSIALHKKQSINGTFIYNRCSGGKFFANVTVSPVILSGKVIGAIEVLRDVTRERNIDRMKTEFISLASHQLRTPLSAMKWFGEMLLDGDAGELTAEQKEYVTNIYLSNERMIDLVNSLLNVSRIESGRIIIDPKPTNLKDLLESVLTEVKPKIDEKKQKLVISIHHDLPVISVDPQLISQVYQNLLTNANKYTPSGGEISIFISEKGSDIISQISDTGYGIPEEDVDKVFQKFYRGENITKKVTEGNGLGLYLVKAIIESSGGKIWYKSEENKGTTFWFSLPKAGSKPQEGEVRINQ